MMRLGEKLLFCISLLVTFLFLMAMKKTPFIAPRDMLIRLENSQQFTAGTLIDTVYDETAECLRLNAGEEGFPAKGEYVTAPLSAGFPLREIIPSWNIYSPDGCGYVADMRVSPDQDKWSAWMYFGKWGTVPAQKKAAGRCPWGAVKTDYFVSDQGILSVQFRFRLYSRKKDMTPEMTLFCLACSDQRGDRNKPLRTSSPKARGLWRTQLAVPYRSQGDEDSSIAGDICSPTSVSMVMSYWGISRPTAEVAQIIYEPDCKLYGMWWRGVQGAAQYGLEGWVQHFRDFEPVKEWIVRGQPVIACICFDAGALTGSMTPESEGHVLVIAGFDDRGNPICNDPAGSSESDGVVTYDAGEFAHAWFDKGGVGYIIARREKHQKLPPLP